MSEAGLVPSQMNNSRTSSASTMAAINPGTIQGGLCGTGGGSTTGGGVRSVTGSWSESTVTWATSPTFGSTNVATKGAVTSGQWAEYDVTSLVKGNGTVSMGIVSGNGDGAAYVSSEGTASQRPQLVVTPNG